MVSKNECFYLGIDIGSVTLYYVLLDQNSNIVQCDYIFHPGNILSALEQQLKKYRSAKSRQGCLRPQIYRFFNQGKNVNQQVVLIEDVRYQLGEVDTIQPYYPTKSCNIFLLIF